MHLMNQPHKALLTSGIGLLLTACGGGGDSGTNDNSAVPTGRLGQVTALSTGYLQSGTYTPTDCVDSSNQSVSRKLRLNSNGSIDWLDGNSTVLATYTPNNSTTSTQRESRQLQFAADTSLSYSHWFLRYKIYDSSGSQTLDFQLAQNYLRMQYGSADDSCGASGASAAIVSIPITLDSANLKARLKSVAATSGTTTGWNSSNVLTDTGQTYARFILDASGQINSTYGSTSAAWGDWGDRLASSTTRGYIYESWWAQNSSGASSPTQPTIYLQFGHPTLTFSGTTTAENMSFQIESYSGTTPVVTMGATSSGPR